MGLTLCALLARDSAVLHSGALQGIQVVAVAVVAQAVWSLASTLAPDRPRGTVALVAAVVTLVWLLPEVQVVTIAAAALFGWRAQPRSMAGAPWVTTVPLDRRLAVGALALLVGLPQPNGVVGAALALGAIFLPAFLLVIGILPFWSLLRGQSAVQGAVWGVNAAVVGLLLATLYTPLWTTTVQRPVDAALMLVAFGPLVLWRMPPLAVVVLAALAGAVGG